MFDVYHSNKNTNNFKINAVTGAILKNHPKSWFERFHLTSDRAKQLLIENGHQATKKEYRNNDRYYDTYTVADPDKNIIVLQMVICGDMEVIAECVYAKDYDINNAPEGGKRDERLSL